MTPEELATFVPSLEELRAVVDVSCLTQGTSPVVSRASAFRKTIWVGDALPVKILGLSLSFEYWAMPASDTAFWSFSADIYAGGAFSRTCARRSTQNTGADANGGIVARRPWTFDAATWAQSTVGPGEVLTVNIVPTGSPAAVLVPMTVGIRYAPQ